jgi:hypothetical protein
VRRILLGGRLRLLRFSLGGDEYSEKGENNGADDHGVKQEIFAANHTDSGDGSGGELSGGCMARGVRHKDNRGMVRRVNR